MDVPPGGLGWCQEGGGGTSAHLPREAGRLVLSQAKAASPQGHWGTAGGVGFSSQLPCALLAPAWSPLKV